MNIENLFVEATRAKYRFETQVGLLTVEDLWQLPLTSTTKANLNTVAISLNRELKTTDESFVEEKSSKNTVLENKLEIVKYVIRVRQEENAAKVELANKAAQREKLKELIAKKEGESLEALSLDELKAMAANL
jgi:hypothetical protein